MSELTPAVVFRVGGRRYAVPLGCVERIVRAVEVTPVPGAPPIVLGAVNVEGRVLPVLSLRRRFGLPARDIDPADHFLIASTAARTVVLVIDEADGVIEPHRSAVTAADEIIPGLEHVHGVARLDDGLVLIHDLRSFLSLEEANALDEALTQAQRC